MNKSELVNLYGFEMELTTKMLNAIPKDQIDFKPHEKSSSIKDLIKSFIVESIMNEHFLKGESPSDPMSMVEDFTTVDEGLAQFEKQKQEFLASLTETSPEDIDAPFSMWGLDGTRGTILHAMMRDMIHHRGQLSVYVRLSGGLVPSTYGPSADDKGGY